MPTFYSNRTEAAATLAKIPARVSLGAVTEVAKYTLLAGFTTADIIEMVKVRAGFTVLEVQLSCNASVGATANLSVGDGASAARFITSTAHTAATITRLNAPATGAGFVYTSDDTIDITAVSIATLVPGTILTLVVVGHYL
jgi:hypothetical protein